MRAIQIQRAGGPEVLQAHDVPPPKAGPGQARVRVEAAGVNFIDVYHRSGAYPLELPAVIGMEAAGVVEALGAGVDDLREGDRVAYAMTSGSYAEQAVVAADTLVPVPDGIDSRTAAALMLQGMTAHYLASSTFALQPGHVALVHAAAGGVGHLLVQVAKHRGATVIATASSEEKARLARDAGADEVIRYTEVDFAAAAAELVGGGIDVVYDSVGKDTFRRSLECLRPRGYLVLYGQSSGRVEPLDPQILNTEGSLFLTRPTLAHYVADRIELRQRAEDLFRWVGDGTLHVRIDRTWPLAEAAEAHRYLEARQSKGKLLLIP